MKQVVGGNAEIHGVGLFLAIAALVLAAFAAGVGFMTFVSGRDQVAAVKDDVIRLEGEVKDLNIRLDEMKVK